jgi:hypothetical protein
MSVNSLGPAFGELAECAPASVQLGKNDDCKAYTRRNVSGRSRGKSAPQFRPKNGSDKTKSRRDASAPRVNKLLARRERTPPPPEVDSRRPYRLTGVL